MKNENKSFIKDNRHHYDILIKAGYVSQLDGATRQRMRDIIREEINPTYNTDLWCSTCVAEMIKYLYTHIK